MSAPLEAIKAAYRKLRRAWLATKFYLFNHFVTSVPVYAVRHFYLRRFLGVRIGKRAAVHMGCFITGSNVTIGDNSVVNRRCYLDGRVGVVIGRNVSISPECYILSLTHQPQNPSFAATGKKVSIDDYAWLGVRCIVLPGVEIARGCVVGAGAVVTKSFSPDQIIAGVPASVVGQRRPEYAYSLDYFPLFDTDVVL